MSDILNQRPEIHQISAAFVSYRNDIEIYTEDEIDDKEFYRILFTRLLDGTGIKVTDIHPLGSCKQVEMAHDTDTNLKKKIYITDGDIFIMYAPKTSSRHKYVLDSYCIENYVCDENSITHSLYDKLASKPLQDCCQLLDFYSRIDAVKVEFMDVFYHYALENKLHGVYKMLPVDSCINQKDLSLNTVNINRIKTGIINELKDAGFSDGVIQQALNDIKTNFPATQENFMKVLSGKDWLLRYFELIVCNLSGNRTKETNRRLKFKHAQVCDLTRLEGLKQAFINVANNYTS